MTESNSIPIMRKPTDTMSNGLNSSNLAAAAIQRHPIDQMQRSTSSSGESSSPLDLDAVRRLYGSGLAMKLATERQLASNVGGRLPGLDAHPDSRAMYESLTGEDMTLGFGDFLNVRTNRPEVGGGDKIPHNAMESRLRL